jgi:hypothetical protein
MSANLSSLSRSSEGGSHLTAIASGPTLTSGSFLHGDHVWLGETQADIEGVHRRHRTGRASVGFTLPRLCSPDWIDVTVCGVAIGSDRLVWPSLTSVRVAWTSYMGVVGTGVVILRWLSAIPAIVLAVAAPAAATDPNTAARREMVRVIETIAAMSGGGATPRILDPQTLDAMRRVPRDAFVPAAADWPWPDHLPVAPEAAPFDGICPVTAEPNGARRSRYAIIPDWVSPRDLTTHLHPPEHAPWQTAPPFMSITIAQLPLPLQPQLIVATPSPSELRTSAMRLVPTSLNSKPLLAFSTLLLLTGFALTRVPVGIHSSFTNLDEASDYQQLFEPIASECCLLTSACSPPS